VSKAGVTRAMASVTVEFLVVGFGARVTALSACYMESRGTQTANTYVIAFYLDLCEARRRATA